MNYSGKFDGRLPADSVGLHSHGQGYVESFSKHATHVPAGAIIVPDAQLLFNGDFTRTGVDLVLSRDERELVLHDYFKGEKRAALASPDGAHLSGDVVDALTGHTQFAQADPSAGAGKVIGHVSKLAGSATAIRNGVSIILNNGDDVQQGDVIQSGPNSTVGITFIDGTVFGLSSNARMVLNEMVYDPNGSSNSSLLSLVAGAITFVAGETAKHGDMKVDTPVATMGIRGTAVLVEIDFNIPGQGGTPDAKFQVLVEPDGHTGSYILFDKTTLTPIATVNQAGQQINISQGQISITSAPLSPELQKLITDVFSLKFTDNSNTKTFEHYTDSVIPQTFGGFKLPDGTTALPVFLTLKTADPGPPPPSNGSPPIQQRVDGPPTAVIVDSSGHPASAFAIIERAGKTGDSTDFDSVSVKVSWVDFNLGDVPTASAKFDSFKYQNAQHQDISATLNALQLADIAAVEAKLEAVPDAGNKNNGSATFIYSFADKAFDFLAAGETLTLTYLMKVENNFPANDEWTTLPFTITITGTNDVPVITTSVSVLAFTGDHEVVAGFLSTTDPTTGKTVSSPSGTLDFKDPDLTDTHSVSVALANPSWSGGAVPPGPLAAFKAALTAQIGTDSTGTGNGIINWQLAQLPDYLADFLPKGETLTLTYAITVTDSLGATATQYISVTVTHTGPPDVAWIHATGGSWSTASNWETGTVPTAADDVVIPDEQVIGGTGNYPVTISSDAVAHSVTLNADNTTGAKLINDDSTLTIGAALTLLADGVLDNSGAISVGSKIELLNQSSLLNSGLMTLAQGGDFKDQSTVTNTGTIDVKGGTLNIQVDVANAGGEVNGNIAVDGGAKLTLNTATITGGTVTNNGEIDLTGKAVLKNGKLGNSGTIDITGGGNALDGETVTANHALQVMAGGALLLDHGTTIANGGGAITVHGTGTLTLDDATITGGALGNSGTVNAGGASALTAVATTNNANDLLEVTSGELTVTNGSVSNAGNIEVVAGTLVLDSLTVTNSVGEVNGTVQVDASSLLDLESATISGGILSNSGTVNSTGTSALTNVGITNTGTIEATSGTLTIDPATFTNTGTLEAISGGTLVLDGETVTNSVDEVNGTVQVDASSLLDLESATITGGILSNSGTVNSTGTSALTNVGIANTGIIEVTSGTLTIDPATFTNTGTLEAISGGMLVLDGETVTNSVGDVNGIVQVDASSFLDLESATISGGILTNKTGGTIALNGGVVKSGTLGNSGQINVTGTGNSLDGETVTANYGLEVMAGAALLLDLGTTVANGGGTITVDGTGTLTLNGAAITGGTINDYSFDSVTYAVVAGLVDVAGTSMISGASLNQGNLKIEQGVSLTLDNVAVTGTSIEVDGIATPTIGNLILKNATTISGSQLTIDSGDKVTLGGATITGGTITDNGGIDVTASSTIKGNAVLNGGGVTIKSGQTLTLDNVTVTNTAFNDTADGAIIQIDDGTTLTLNGAIINGGTINDGTATGTVSGDSTVFGDIDVTGNSTVSNASLNNGNLKISQGNSLTLNNVVLAGTSIEVDGVIGAPIGNLILTNGTTISGSQLTIDSGDQLTLDGATISGGAVTDNGSIDATSSSTVNGNAKLNNGKATVESGVTLTLDNVTVNGTSFTDTATGAGLAVGSGSTLTLEGGAVVTGGSLINAGAVQIETVSGATLDGVSVSGGGKIAVDITSITTANPATLTLDDGTTVTGGTLSIGKVGTLDIERGADGPGATLDGVTVTGADATSITPASLIEVGVSSAATLTLVDGTTVGFGTLAIGAQGALDSHSGENAISGVAISNCGLFEVTGGTLTVDATSSVSSIGTLEVNGGNLIIDGTMSGSAKIIGASLLELGGNSAYSSAKIIFDSAATGTLQLDHSEAFQGTVSGLDHNALDLRDITSGANTTITYSGDSTGGTLTIVSNADCSQVASIKLTGNYLGAHWVAASDGPNGGTTITEAPGAVAGLDSNGNASEGSAVTASITDGGKSVTNVTYHWEIFDSIQNKWVDGSGIGVTSATYTPGEQDEGHALRVSISFTDALQNADNTTVSAGTVKPVSDTPSVAAATPELSLNENDANVAIAGVSVAPAAGDASDPVTVTLHVANGTLSMNGSLDAFASIGSNGSDTVTVSGLASDVNTVLASLTYTATSNFSGSDTLHVKATSTDGTAAASVTSPEATVAITVVPVVDSAWSTLGTVAVQTVHDSVLPSSGKYMAFLDSSPSTELAVENFLGLQAGSLAQLPTGYYKNPTDGSAIQTTLVLKAGDKVTFDWDFIAHDYSPFDDFSFVAINGVAHLLSEIAKVGSYGTTGWKTFSYTAPITGTYKIGMGQFNTGDTALNSHLLVDNLEINGVSTHSFENGTFAGAAQADHWISSSSGSWTTGSNWSSGVPNSNDAAALDASGIYTVTSSTGVALSKFTSAANATLQITGGNFTVANYAGQGPLILSGGTLGIGSSTANVASLTQSGGTLTGTGTLTVAGTSLLAGGTESGAGKTIAAGAATLFNSLLQTFTLDGGHILQLGAASSVADVTAASFGETLNLNNGSELIIASGATLTDQTTIGGGAGLTINGSGGAVAINEGTYTKTGNGTTLVNVGFDNAGTVNVESGTFQFVSITGTGSLHIFGAATLEIIGSDTSSVTFESGSSGTLDIAQTIVPNSPLTFGGQISGLTSNNTIDLAGLTFDATSGNMTVATSVSGGNTTATVTNKVTHQSVILHLAGDYSGSAWTFTSDGHGGTNLVDPVAGSGNLKIYGGATLYIGTASAATVTFANNSGTTGALVLDDSRDFTGTIVGFAGTKPDAAHSDIVDLMGIDFNSSHFVESYNASTGLLAVTDGNHTANLTFADFTGTLKFASDGSGGTLITDPPPSGSSHAASGESGGVKFDDGKIGFDPGAASTQLGPVVTHDPGQAPSDTIVASVPTAALNGHGSGDGFAFNFAGIGLDTAMDFHPAADAVKFGSPIFANAQAAWNAAQDDHGNTVVTPDAHDTITLSGILKAQLHANDFHFV